jgi:hypothetical protein
VYQLTLTAWDNRGQPSGLSGDKTVSITVKAATEPRVIPDTDTMSVGVGGMRGFWPDSDGDPPNGFQELANPTPGKAELLLNGLSGPVRKAFLYWHGPTDSKDPLINSTVSVNGRLVEGMSLGLNFHNGWAYHNNGHSFANSHAYRADITALVNSFKAGPYKLENFVKGAEVENNGASIVAFFDDNTTGNNVDAVLVDGNDSSGSINFFPAGDVNMIARHGNDGFVIVGRFPSFNTTGRNGIAKLRPDGTLHTGFAPESGFATLNGQLTYESLCTQTSDIQPHAALVQPDGKVVVGGLFDTVDGGARQNLARFTAAGNLDASFNVSVNGPVYAIIADVQ